MLLTFSAQNFRTFREEFLFDMRRKHFTATQPKDGAWADNVHHLAGIFGPNAAGKSTLLDALLLLSEHAEHTLESGWDAARLHEYYKGDPACRDEPTIFDLEFVVAGARYRWYLAIDDDGVLEESLEVAVTSRWRNLYSRTRDGVTYGASSGITKDTQRAMAKLLNPHVLLLGALRVFDDGGGVAAAASQWIRTGIVRLPSGAGGSAYETVIAHAITQPQWRQVASEILRTADAGIEEIRLEESQLPAELLTRIHTPHSTYAGPTDKNGFHFPTTTTNGAAGADLKLSEEEIRHILRSIRLVHRGTPTTFELTLTQESTGTKTLLGLMLFVVSAIHNGHTVLADELSNSLHVELVTQILKLFREDRFTAGGAQLIFTSHDASLMDTFNDAGTIDAVWLAKRENSGSCLLSLGDFTIRRQHRASKRYREGRFGGIPFAELDLGAPIDRIINDAHRDQDPRR